MTTVPKNLVKLAHISLALLFFAAWGCKSVKPVANAAKYRALDYKTQKAFETSYFEANKQKLLNNKEKALELYTSALSLNPQSHATMYQMAKLNYQLENFSEALVYAETAVNTADVYNHWYHGLLAQYYNKFGKYEKSAAVFVQMIENEPDVRENYTEAASQYYNAKELDKSVAVLKRMQERFGIEKESSTRLDFIYSSMGEQDKAIVEMEKLVQSYPENVQYKGYLSETYMKAGRKSEAIALLEQIIKDDPEIGKAHYALYSIKSEAGKEDEAINHLKEAFRYDDLSLQQKMQAVSVYLNGLRSDTSLRTDLLEFSDILESLYTNTVEPFVLRSDIYGTLGDYDLARKNIRKALELDPSEFHLWSKLLGVNARLNDLDKQIEDTEEALELFPNVIELYISQSYAYIEKKNYAKGIAVADEGLDVAIDKRDRIQLMLCKASAYEKQSNYVLAEKYFEETLQINPYNGMVLNNYAYSLANRKEQLDKADSLITIALKLEPSNPYYLDTKAWILYGKGEYEQALKILNKCIEIDPKGEDYYKHARECYKALGNSNMANEMQQKLDNLKNE